ncbi:hypothetical protein T492DRAFT_1064474 [Pavlovales sp. CCMP2436]|nr:hypothetical protein T492DRAFT_1064474 [Pavlovales sp. CCMP2436]
MAGGIAVATMGASTVVALRAAQVISAVKDVSRATLVNPLACVPVVTRLTYVAGACAATARCVVDAASIVTGVAVTLSITLVVVPLTRAARAPLDAAGALGAWLKRPAPAVAQPARPIAIPARPPAVLCSSGEPSTGPSRVTLSTLELGVTAAGMAVGAATTLAILPLYAAVTLASSPFKHFRSRANERTLLDGEHAAPQRAAPRRGVHWCLFVLVTLLPIFAAFALLISRCSPLPAGLSVQNAQAAQSVLPAIALNRSMKRIAEKYSVALRALSD